MKHVFKATKLGWEKEKEVIWFDSDDYIAQEARDEFKPYEGTTQEAIHILDTNMMVRNIMM